MNVADLLDALSDAYPGDSVRVMVRVPGSRKNGGTSAVLISETIRTSALGDGVLILRPAVELRHGDDPILTETHPIGKDPAAAQQGDLATELHDLREQQRLTIQKAVLYRRAADTAMRNAMALIDAGRYDEARAYLNSCLPENRKGNGITMAPPLPDLPASANFDATPPRKNGANGSHQGTG